MRRCYKILLFTVIIACSIACDQALKSLARSELRDSPSRIYAGGWIRLQYAENPGAFLGLGSELPPVLRASFSVLLAVIVCAGFTWLILNVHRLRPGRALAFSLLIAGGFGNSIDRLSGKGLVVDYLVLGTDFLHTGIFNFADFCITSGVIILVAGEFLGRRSA